ncbi:hypothetical protein EFL59_00790, partial [Weissella confusa]|nr:hypothetical protein [Weissella confusa]
MVDKLNDVIKTGTTDDIKKAVDNVNTALDTIIPANVADDKGVTDAKTAVDEALNNGGDVTK